MKFMPKEDGSLGHAVEAAEPMGSAKKGSTSEGRGSKASNAIESNEKVVFQTQADAPPCHECGSIMIRSGSCYKCLQCGSTSGCS